MIGTFPLTATNFIGKPWSEIGPLYTNLEERQLTHDTLHSFLVDWSSLEDRMDETYRRLEVITTQHTADDEAAQRFQRFIEQVQGPAKEAGQRLRTKLLHSGLEPDSFSVPLRKMRAEHDLFREENLPLFAREQALVGEYFGIRGAQTVEWDGEEIPVARLRTEMERTDRDRRERAWRLMRERQRADGDAIGAIWLQLLDTRRTMAANASQPEYRAFRWRQLHRFDYGPEDARTFHASIEEVVVPVARRSHERRRQQMGLDVLRPWDQRVDPRGRPPLRPFATVAEAQERSTTIFHRLDPELGRYFQRMIDDHLLDLEDRVNKAPVGYSLPFNASGVPFIFLRMMGMHDDLVGLFHEGGHAFHTYETRIWPYFWQRNTEGIPAEFAEVASMSMEFLVQPYLTRANGGFYDERDAARATIQHLETAIELWCYVAAVDAFQHWVYENPEEASSIDACDVAYSQLLDRFEPSVDWTGLEAERASGWQVIPHIFDTPFYFIEYGLAQLGAAQIWARAMLDEKDAVRRYREALRLGDTEPLPRLFEATGAKLSFDATTLRESVSLMEETIDRLGAVAG